MRDSKGRFIKGAKIPEEWRLMGAAKSPITKKGSVPWNKGKKDVYSSEHKKYLSEKLKGHTVSQETRDRIKSNTPIRTGERNNMWKGGITPVNQKIRGSIEYKLWRESVFTRDNWTCVWCKVKGGNLNADHIKPFAFFPELRFAIDNGRTLCVDCHKKTGSYLNRWYKHEKD